VHGPLVSNRMLGFRTAAVDILTGFRSGTLASATAPGDNANANLNQRRLPIVKRLIAHTKMVPGRDRRRSSVRTATAFVWLGALPGVVAPLFEHEHWLLREAEADIAHAKDGTEILDCLYVMETGMRYFFTRAQAARNVKGNEAVVGRICWKL